MDSSELHELHIAFLPLMAPGHIIPMLDIVSLIAARGVKVTVITTALNATNYFKFLQNQTTTTNITLEIFPFPSKESGLPDGVENLENSTSFEMGVQFMKSLQIMKHPLDNFLGKTRPHCLVADLFFSFATEAAAKLGIPRLVFHGSSYFSACMTEAIKKHQPHNSVASDDEYFTIPDLPHEIKFTKSQLLPKGDEGSINRTFTELFIACLEAESKSYGTIFNSFYELEQGYVEYFRSVLGRRSWHIGPVSLCNQQIEEKFQRGKMASIDKDECLRWLDSKDPNSVIYVCFGSLIVSTASLIHEIAMALEASELNFIWAIYKKGNEEECWPLPTGFEERMEGKGVVIRGWAPQLLILNHEAVGGFVNHCGWNSTIESISAGVPMVTWPILADQFENEKLVTDVLRIGVPVGSKVWNGKDMTVKKEDIEMAMKRVMTGEEGAEMRKRANKLKELALKAVEEDGSSFCELSGLIQELTNFRDNKLPSSDESK